MTGLRFSANMALLARVEAVSGTAETTYTGTDVVLLTEEPEITFEPVNIDRNLVRPYWGASEQIQGTHLAKLKFKTELAPSGSPGVAPAVGKLLRGCAFAETIVATTRVEYAPISQVTESLSFRFFNDGVRYVTRGARGRAKLNLDAYKTPTAEFEFWGIGKTVAAAALPTVSYAGTIVPLAVTAANSSDFLLGTTLTAGAVSGGTSYPARALSIDIANDLQHYLNTRDEQVGIASRRITGKTSVILDETQELAWYDDIKNLTTSTASFVHGVGAGNQIIVHGSRVQRSAMDRDSDRGRLYFGADLTFIPSNGWTGGDDLKLIFK